MRYAILNRPIASGGQWMAHLTTWSGRINSQSANWKEIFTATPPTLLSTMQLPSDPVYVTWAQFEWILGGIVAAQGVVTTMTLSVVKYMLRGHSKEDDARFKALGERLELEHAENKASLQTLRADMLRSNELLFEELRSIRRLFDEFLLKQLPPR